MMHPCSVLISHLAFVPVIVSGRSGHVLDLDIVISASKFTGVRALLHFWSPSPETSVQTMQQECLQLYPRLVHLISSLPNYNQSCIPSVVRFLSCCLFGVGLLGEDDETLQSAQNRRLVRNGFSGLPCRPYELESRTLTGPKHGRQEIHDRLG